MYTFSQIEHIAREGGYTVGQRQISRITTTDVQQVYGGLVHSGSEEAHSAAVVVSKLRHWLVHGGNVPPPVRGAGYVRSDREVWLAYTTHESPVLVRGKASALADLRSYLSVATSPGYDGSLSVRTDPPIQLVGTVAGAAGIELRTPLGSLVLDRRAASVVEQWLSVTMRRKDRRGVLCLPGEWTRY